jgi:uncharacterized protein YyaL (SSP411 family)
MRPAMTTPSWPLLLGLLLLLAGAWAAAAPPARAQDPTNAERARRAYTALRRDFTDDDRQLSPVMLRGEGHKYPYIWPLSQVLSGALAMSAMPMGGGTMQDARRYVAGFADYWDTRVAPDRRRSPAAPPLGTGGDLYYDDNAWVGLALLDYHRMTGDPAALASARRVFDLLVSGWDREPTSTAPGGILWVRASWNYHRNTVSTAPAALMGLHLFELTREQNYWDWSGRMFAWLNQYMRAPDGLYWDHITPDGAIDTTIRSYNQGAVIGVALTFFRLSGNQAYLRHAEEIADASLRYWGQNRIAQDQPGFNAILCRYLLALWAQTGTQGYRRFVEDYADYAWRTLRDPLTDIFVFPLQGNAGQGEQAVLGQAAMVQINALLAWEPPTRLLRLVASDPVARALAPPDVGVMAALLPRSSVRAGGAGETFLLRWPVLCPDNRARALPVEARGGGAMLMVAGVTQATRSAALVGVPPPLPAVCALPRAFVE